MTDSPLLRHHTRNNGDPVCASRFSDGEAFYACTRRDGHVVHEAFDGARIIEVWDDDEALLEPEKDGSR